MTAQKPCLKHMFNAKRPKKLLCGASTRPTRHRTNSSRCDVYSGKAPCVSVACWRHRAFVTTGGPKSRRHWNSPGKRLSADRMNRRGPRRHPPVRLSIASIPRPVRAPGAQGTRGKNHGTRALLCTNWTHPCRICAIAGRVFRMRAHVRTLCASNS